MIDFNLRVVDHLRENIEYFKIGKGFTGSNLSYFQPDLLVPAYTTQPRYQSSLDLEEELVRSKFGIIFH